MKKKREQKTFTYLFFFLFFLISIYLVNILITTNILSSISFQQPQQPIFLTIIEAECEECFDIENLVNFLKSNFNVAKIRRFDKESGSNFIKTYNITSLPSLIITGQIKDQDFLVFLNNIGAEIGENVVIIQGIPPFYDLKTNEVKGLVSLIFLKDKACEECYEVEAHSIILKRFGIFIKESTSYDISSEEGKEILNKYKIEKIPTILLSPEASYYKIFNQVWEEVGSIEEDGWYVFRNLEIMGTYKDLKKNKIVKSSLKEIVVEGKEFEFVPSSITVKKGERIRIIFKNVGNSIHNFGISELGIRSRNIQPGEIDIIEFVAQESGTFSFDCNIPGHREAGMIGSLTIV